jgi:hypothetical protein
MTLSTPGGYCSISYYLASNNTNYQNITAVVSSSTTLNMTFLNATRVFSVATPIDVDTGVFAMTLYAVESKHPTTIINSYSFNLNIVNWCSIDNITNNGPYNGTIDVV